MNELRFKCGHWKVRIGFLQEEYSTSLAGRMSTRTMTCSPEERVGLMHVDLTGPVCRPKLETIGRDINWKDKETVGFSGPMGGW